MGAVDVEDAAADYVEGTAVIDDEIAAVVDFEGAPVVDFEGTAVEDELAADKNGEGTAGVDIDTAT